MQDLSLLSSAAFSNVRFVLTDMDETLTHRGRLSSRAYDALERLQSAGIKVIPVTAAPAGWCDQMARMWPVDGVIAENGGLFIRRATIGHGVQRSFWHAEDCVDIKNRLAEMGRKVTRMISQATLADDQPFRLASLAFALRDDQTCRKEMVAALHEAGANVAINNLWIICWLGGFDKLAMTRRVTNEFYGVNIEAERDSILYCGDSGNDAPMFAFFRHTVGVSTVRNHLSEIPILPNWITKGPGGDGFVEAADAVIASSLR
jgi:HAD superfamily hydrolase (TIGR01484 family)